MCKALVCQGASVILVGPNQQSLDATRAQVRCRAVTDYSQVDMPGSRYESVNFGAGKSPGSADW